MSGSHSIYQNIPHPQVFTHDKHACVRLQDVIEHLLARGLLFDTIDLEAAPLPHGHRASSVTDTMAVQAMCARVRRRLDVVEKPMVLYVIFWSDDFEVTYVKTTSSVWVHTVTVCPPPGHTTSPRYTHALAISYKRQNHDSVLALYHRELQHLNQSHQMYCGKTKKMVPVVVELLILAADRPERAAINCILSHSGNSTARWMHSALIDPAVLWSCK